MKKIIKEFKDFALKGNMLDIAIGVIIGAAFNNVVDVLVKKVLMPPLSLLTNDINFENKKITLRKGIEQGGEIIREEVAIAYGELITVFINFFVISCTVFIIIKVFNKLQHKAENPNDKTVKTPKDIELLTRIKVLMEEQNKLLQKRNTPPKS
ncbi:large conductance mechanosensitive channel [Mesonia hippocampi]|uniref:Large-conductance mechanosensitive channel n=1 Tax=Mesonia hippocampi TaxID=1628250 RepID=A0A840ERH7_9FLAO|nr:large conductance mechanosensitive channel protein MscL [Mesonia hippocampi]MBB4119641.1 large conductance mechanosensitive channel [Mesonia hippocampi]